MILSSQQEQYLGQALIWGLTEPDAEAYPGFDSPQVPQSLQQLVRLPHSERAVNPAALAAIVRMWNALSSYLHCQTDLFALLNSEEPLPELYCPDQPLPLLNVADLLHRLKDPIEWEAIEDNRPRLEELIDPLARVYLTEASSEGTALEVLLETLLVQSACLNEQIIRKRLFSPDLLVHTA